MSADPDGRGLGREPGGPTLDELRGMWEHLDPVPAGLVDRVGFALEVEALTSSDLELELELMRLVQEEPVTSGSRGDEVRTITFGSDSMTVMLALTEVPGGYRVDGWVAPGGRRRLEVRTGSVTDQTESDSTGRFTVPLVPPGHFQLVLDGDVVGAEPGPRRTVVTPALTL